MIFLEIAVFVIILTFIAWLFGVDGEKIVSFYAGILLLLSITALFAALTAYFITLFMPPC